MNDLLLKKDMVIIKKSFKHQKYSTETALSGHVWKLKERNLESSVQFEVVDRAQPYSPVSGVCNLCTLEKYYILFGNPSLNKHNEVFKPLEIPVVR